MSIRFKSGYKCEFQVGDKSVVCMNMVAIEMKIKNIVVLSSFIFFTIFAFRFGTYKNQHFFY